MEESNKHWLKNGVKTPVIAGPCSAESREQVLSTCQQLSESGKVQIFRAGIWKPRTKPGQFEGVGAKGLPWMAEAKERFGLPLAVEVAKASHVELCLEFGIDIFWVGARTSVNPFAVQEIADALRGVDVPVLVKNPINPDLALWLGSVERIRGAGIAHTGAIHRGFSNLGEKFYRNRPHWQIALQFKEEMPDIPMLCDPSHICGRRETLQAVSQKALDLSFDGLMIESHIDPDVALSDSKQQLTPEALHEMIDKLVVRSGKENDQQLQNSLGELRRTISHLDEQLINLLSKRMEVARDIGHIKKENEMTVLQTKRWSEVVKRNRLVAREQDLSEEFILRYLKAVHDESINQQTLVMNGLK